VLVVEDDQGIARLVEEMLLDEHFIVVPVGSAEAALQYLESESTPDAIVFDLILPDMDGRQFFEQARARGMNIPSLLVSAWPTAEAVAEELKVPCLKKPFDVDELVAAVYQLLDGPPRPPAGPEE
jgi:DNA-binding response OmpR family regulator